MRIGVDLGGTKIEALALADDGRELERMRVPTPAASAEAIVAAIAALVGRIEAARGERGSLGVGTPGALSPATGRMKNSNTTSLNGTRLDVMLAEALDRPVRLANDADCFALSEAVDGAGAGATTVFGAILGTGTGGGVVVEGRLLQGPNRVAGEWGHNPLPWAEADDRAEACYCGKRGCIETYLSGPGMTRDHRARGGREDDARAIVRAAGRGDAAACATIRRYLRRLGKALASVINLLDPDVVVLGGGLSNVDAIYGPELSAAIAEHAFSDAVTTPVRRARHGDSSGVRGAAWLWRQA